MTARNALIPIALISTACAGPYEEFATAESDLTGPVTNVPVWSSSNSRDLEPENSSFRRRVCPENQIVVGFSTAQDSSGSPTAHWAASLRLRCSRTVFTGSRYQPTGPVGSVFVFDETTRTDQTGLLPGIRIARGIDTRINLNDRHIRKMRIQGNEYDATGDVPGTFGQTGLLPTLPHGITKPVNPYGNCLTVSPLHAMVSVDVHFDTRSGRRGRIRHLSIGCQELSP